MSVLGSIARVARRWPGLFAVPLVVLLTAGTAVLSPQAAAGPAPDPQALLAQVSPAVGIVHGMVGTRTISGTAFVIDREGWLLTAAHVARHAEKVRVELPGVSPLDAQVIGYDASRDLAILRVNPPSPLFALTLARDSLNIGDAVAVVGAPRGLPDQIITGEVVATHVSVPGLARAIFVRSSVLVRPGVSGSPLLNSQGQVVGLIVAASFNGSSGRSSLAVSEETIQAALPQLRQGAHVERAWIGIAGGPNPETPPDAGAAQGASVREVIPQSPAAAAGVRPGDIVVEFEGAAIHSWADLLTAVGQRQPGQSAHLVVLRDGQRVDVAVTLGVRP